MYITIIVNCHNSEEYISETAKSLSGQTYRNFEVLFIDNQSTDNSFSKFKSNSNFKIRYIPTPNFMSLYDARNYAILKVNTALVCFIDADDLWSPFYLQEVFNFHTSNPEILASQSSVISFRDGFKRNEITKNFKKNSFLNPRIYSKSPFTALSGLALKNEFFSDYKFPSNSNFIGDLDIVLTLASLNQLYYLYEPVFYYRIHKRGLTSRNLSGWHEELSKWLKTTKLILPKELSKKFNNDSKYILLRNLLSKQSFLESISLIMKSEIPLTYRIKLLLRKILKIK